MSHSAQTAAEFYQSSIAHSEKAVKQLSSRDQWLVLARLTSIGLAGFAGYWSIAHSLLWLFPAVLGLALFGFFLKRHLDNKEALRFYRIKTQLAKAETDALNGQRSGFISGERFSDPEHLFAHDLDLFGKGGVFQWLNRSSTSLGEQFVARSLKEEAPAFDFDLRQRLVGELSDRMDWMLEHRAKAQLHEEVEQAPKRIAQLVSGDRSPAKWASPYLLVLLSLGCIGLLFSSILLRDLQLFQAFGALFVLNLVVTQRHLKQIQAAVEDLGEMQKSLKRYSVLIQSADSANWNSEAWESFKQGFGGREKNASVALKSLSRLASRFDQVHNLLVALVTNGLYHNHLHALYAFESWKKHYGDELPNWLESLAELDLLISLAHFKFNQPESQFPVKRDEPTFKATALGHPLLLPTQRVHNDVDFSPQHLILLTGSNMSGKSTFLRSLGVNLILAKMGGVVCADHFEFYPFELLSSMKLNDDLSKSESYFLAEVLRLRKIVSRLEQGNPSFVLLDEILKGTNSDDKRRGTEGFIEQLLEKGAWGILATHDIEVTRKSKEHPEALRNAYFESKLKEGNLSFDYRLREGVCTTPNATQLMVNYGIITS